LITSIPWLLCTLIAPFPMPRAIMTVFFLSRTLAVLFVIQNVSLPEIISQAGKQLFYDAIPFLEFFLTFFTLLLLKDGFAVSPRTKEFFKSHTNICTTLLDASSGHPVPYGAGSCVARNMQNRLLLCKMQKKGIWPSGTGTVLTVFSLLLPAGFNHTAYFPSTFNL
jgi:cytochrome bd ubiquinol oxidase subunit II